MRRLLFLLTLFSVQTLAQIPISGRVHLDFKELTAETFPKGQVQTYEQVQQILETEHERQVETFGPTVAPPPAAAHPYTGHSFLRNRG